ncbi:unnamed protein product [Ixodes pacificus]
MRKSAVVVFALTASLNVRAPCAQKVPSRVSLYSPPKTSEARRQPRGQPGRSVVRRRTRGRCPVAGSPGGGQVIAGKEGERGRPAVAVGSDVHAKRLRRRPGHAGNLALPGQNPPQVRPSPEGGRSSGSRDGRADAAAQSAWKRPHGRTRSVRRRKWQLETAERKGSGGPTVPRTTHRLTGRGPAERHAVGAPVARARPGRVLVQGTVSTGARKRGTRLLLGCWSGDDGGRRDRSPWLQKNDQCKMMQRALLPLLVAAACALGLTLACNEAICASIVSKCMLTQSCKCDKLNVTCSRDCFYCLDYLYTECCSCVEMCPRANETISLSHKSNIEDLPDPTHGLFALLTEEADRSLRWRSYTFPVHVALYSPVHDKDIKFKAVVSSGNTSELSEEEDVQVNCTVAFMSQCMSLNKCRESCLSMGASSYRWFHDGCCQCVGSMCINYGINESRCLQCPYSKELMDLDEEQDEEVPIEDPERHVYHRVDYPDNYYSAKEKDEDKTNAVDAPAESVHST